jgi:hypothetical protein
MAFSMNTPPRSQDDDRRSGLDAGSWPEPPGRVRATLGALGFGLLIAFAAVVVVSGSGSGAPTEASVAQIVAQPAAFEGDRVVSDGEVDELLTDRALVVQDQGTDDELLVVIRSTAYVSGFPASPSVPFAIHGRVEDEDDVRFTGVVDEFDQEEMADELGIVFNDGLFDRWEGEPSIVVDRLALAAATAAAGT